MTEIEVVEKLGYVRVDDSVIIDVVRWWQVFHGEDGISVNQVDKALNQYRTGLPRVQYYKLREQLDRLVEEQSLEGRIYRPRRAVYGHKEWTVYFAVDWGSWWSLELMVAPQGSVKSPKVDREHRSKLSAAELGEGE